MNIRKEIRFKTDKYLSEKLPSLHNGLHRHKVGIKYVFSGGTAAVVDFVLLYSLTDLIGFWYLYSAIMAYVASFFTAFFLQKFWTFRDSNLGRMKKQLTIYASIAVASLALNSIMMYFLVSILFVWYLAAQFISSGILAIGSFLINKAITFRDVS